MSKYRPLKYRDVVKILSNLGFAPQNTKATSHQTWTLKRGDKSFAVTAFFHGSNTEFKRGTLNSIIRQSGSTKEEFYNALKKRR